MSFVHDRVERVWKLSRGGNAHHAYIFCGPVGLGKFASAKRFAAQITLQSNETSVDLEKCIEKISSNNHPDVSILQTDTKIIAVDLIRDLLPKLAYSPLESEKRIVIIREAEKLKTAAANALLKVLEEPPAYVVFILVCSDFDLLLPTIRSRCQKVNFPPLKLHEFQAELASSGKSPNELEELWYSSDASLQKAKEQLEDTSSRRHADQLLQLWESWPKLPASSIGYLDSISDMKQIKQACGIWLATVRDLNCVIQAELENVDTPKVYFSGNIHRYQQIGAKLLQRTNSYTLTRNLSQKYKIIDNFQIKLIYNVNSKLAVANTFYALQKLEAKGIE